MKKETKEILNSFIIILTIVIVAVYFLEHV